MFLASSCAAVALVGFRRRAAIKGTLRSAAGAFPAGSFYYANEVSALRWVHATLTETALLAHALVLPALTQAFTSRSMLKSAC